MSERSEWKDRLRNKLEPILSARDPRPLISQYHDLPFAILVYPPEAEFELRKEVALLAVRLEGLGKHVTRISLADCLDAALTAEDFGGTALEDSERQRGLELAIDTVHGVLSEYQPLDRVVARRAPADADPLRDIVLITRAGALYPAYRTSALLDQLYGQVHVPAVLFYPGIRTGPRGLKFMGVLDADHSSYRAKIF